MKKLLIVLGLILFGGCGAPIDPVNTTTTIPKSKDNAKVYDFCSDNIINILDSVQIGDCTAGIDCDETVKKVFTDCTTDINKYESGDYCVYIFTFYKYNSQNYSWDYYYSIDTECDEDQIITTIYKD